MSAFEYIVGFHTIVLGLATARLLGTLADTLKYRRSVQGSWVHTGWVVLLQLQLVGWWYAIWRDVRPGLPTELDYFEFVVVLSITVSMYIAAALLDADLDNDRGGDLEEHFRAVRVPFFLALAWPVLLTPLGFAVAISAGEPVRIGDLVTTGEMAVAVALGLALSGRRAQQTVLVGHAVAYLAIEFTQRGIAG